MKVNPLATAAQYFSSVVRGNRVEEKGTTDNAGQESSKKDQGQSGQNSKQEERRATEADVAKAVDAFAGDTLATSNGLHAEVDGSGPGLRVVLKDVSGQILRQYSGDEFVRLREATAKDQHARGKILDQKL